MNSDIVLMSIRLISEVKQQGAMLLGWVTI